MSKITAIIDIGSNSVRMAIFHKTSALGFYLLYEAKSRVRISEGCYEHDGMLQEVPMRRSLNTLKEFVKIAKAYKVRKILTVATSAVRDAPNASYFLALVRREVGLYIRVIDGKKEAYYDALACMNLINCQGGITIDIGGGSTEIALIEDGKIAELLSLDIGTIRLKEMFFDRRFNIREAKSYINKAADGIPKHYHHKVVFGIGGTIRALAKLIMKDNKYLPNALHGFEIEIALYSKLFSKISHAKASYLSSLGVNDDRIDNIRSGTLILEALLERFGSQVIVTSGVGVREGVYLSDLLRNQHQRFPAGFNPSVRSLLDRFPHFNDKRSKLLASALWDTLDPYVGFTKEFKRHLLTAATIFRTGSSMGFFYYNKHSSYIAQNALEYGFSHFDRTLISILIEKNLKRFKAIPRPLLGKDITSAEAALLVLIMQLVEILSFVDSVRFSFTPPLSEPSRGLVSSLRPRQNRHGVLEVIIAHENYLVNESINKLKTPKIKVELLIDESMDKNAGVLSRPCLDETRLADIPKLLDNTKKQTRPQNKGSYKGSYKGRPLNKEGRGQARIRQLGDSDDSASTQSPSQPLLREHPLASRPKRRPRRRYDRRAHSKRERKRDASYEARGGQYRPYEGGYKGAKE